MSRYDLPDPKCRHIPKGYVEAGDPVDGPHASTHVCDRPACVEDAQEWAAAKTLRVPSAFTPFPSSETETAEIMSDPQLVAELKQAQSDDGEGLTGEEARAWAERMMKRTQS